MAHPGKKIEVIIDATRSFQKVDGFGVNINARYWKNGNLIPVMQLLLEDLRATLYRVDIWGKSNWVDPEGELGRQDAFKPTHLESIYGGEVFKRGWAMMRWLNERGIRPYLTASGDVPPWMLAPDGKTLADFDAFTEMMVSMLWWARNHEKLDFNLFGPLNETDIGSPEGPGLGPDEFTQVCELLVDKMNARGLNDIQLVVPEQAHFNPRYLEALTRSRKLLKRIAAFGLHDYSDIPSESYREVTRVIEESPFAGTSLWMTEYGDLEQTGDREWYVAWVMTSRLFDQLEAGFNGSLVWDAFDNYHDHDEAWTIYGLLRTGLRTFTPKKRYYACRQAFRFILPGFERLASSCEDNDLRVLAFANPNRDQLTMIGMNEHLFPARLNITLMGFSNSVELQGFDYHRTSEEENCHRIGRVPAKGKNWPFTGIDIAVPPASIFTLTTVRD